jgi:hypothetical protein
MARLLADCRQAEAQFRIRRRAKAQSHYIDLRSIKARRKDALAAA